jgi:hypothetical protein
LALFLSVMRLLGVRPSFAVLGFGLLAASLGVLGAGSSGLSATRYEVAAPLQLATGGKVFACYAFLLTYPAEGCGGIEVRSVDFSQMPNVEGFPSGAQVSQTMRLVGTWDGRALTLTETPQPAQTAPRLPEPCTQDFSPQPGSDSIQLQIEVTDALRNRGLDVLMSTGCDGMKVGVVLPVADDATVDWLTRHYPVNVVGWLRPLPSGP